MCNEGHALDKFLNQLKFEILILFEYSQYVNNNPLHGFGKIMDVIDVKMFIE
jgi:hypothetical protein